MSAIRTDRRGDALWITIDNAEKRNALGMEDLAALSTALDEAAQAPGLRVLILTGAGDRVFSSGVDLSDIADPSDWSANPLSALCDRLEAFPRPTIARLNGKVRGGAFEVSLACDFRIGVTGMDAMVPAARIGIHYEASGLARAISRMGMQATRRVYLLGEAFGAEALASMGYLDRLVSPDGLDDAVDEMSARLRSGAPLAVDGMKATLSEMATGSLDRDAARARIRATWASGDMKEGLAAIRERRQAVFTGR